MELVSTYPVPESMPNGIQWADEGLYVMDQHTDNVYLLGEGGKVLKTLPTLTENGSGITVGGGYLWTASNGNTHSREYRPTDTHEPAVLKCDLETGELVRRFPTPDGGGIHGMEWDDGLLWLTQFSPKSLTLVDPEDFRVVRKFPCDLDVLHGLARDGEGIWCADRRAHVVAKYHVETGEELDRIVFPDECPEPHGLSIKDGVLGYSDAAFGNGTLSDHPEIGVIVR